MQFKIVLLSVFATLAVADDISSLVAQLPTCATQCLLQGASSAGCTITDYSCQCSHMAQITAASTGCLASACQAADLAKVQSISTQICAQVAGSGTSVSSASSPASTGPSSTASGATNTSPSSTAASTTPSPTKNAASKPELAGMGMLGAALVAGLVL